MISKDTIHSIISDIIKEKNAFIVDVSIGSSNKINIEIDSLTAVTINDCVEINRLIESKLDREQEDYELEVSSAGLSQPFKVIQQYYKNLNKDVEIVTKEGKKTTGILTSVSDKGFEIDESKLVKVEGKKKKQLVTVKQAFAFDQVKSTKIVIKF